MNLSLHPRSGRAQEAPQRGRLNWKRSVGAIYTSSNSNSICSCSLFSCSRMYLRMVSSSSPTVMTLYPLAQKCRPDTRFLPNTVRWKMTALLPFKKPITKAMLYFGGTLSTCFHEYCDVLLFSFYHKYDIASPKKRCNIPRKSPYKIVLESGEEKALKWIAQKYTSPYYEVVHARVILLASKGLENKEIASRVDMPRQIVSKWRKLFFEQRLAGLQDRPGRGRPRRFSP